MHRLELIRFNPVYMDVLQGDFRPATDKLERIHKLSRLVIGTIIKGDAQLTDDLGVEDYLYRPSWAESTTSLVTAVGGEFEDVELEGGVSSLAVRMFTVGGLQKVVLEYGNNPPEEAALELGAELYSLKSMIADSAEDFYKTVYAQS